MMATDDTPPSTLVLLVRHGTTPTTGRVLPGRSTGLHLSDAGREQADRAAQRLAALPVAAVYASPLERTGETAQVTADHLGLPVQEEQGLLECDVGDWTGRELAELSRLPQWRDVQHSPATFAFPGGESIVSMQQRMVTAIARIRAAHLGQVVACFSHADPIKALLAHALGLGLDSFQRFTVSPCSVSAISFPPQGDPMVLTMNSTDEPLTALRPS